MKTKKLNRSLKQLVTLENLILNQDVRVDSAQRNDVMEMRSQIEKAIVAIEANKQAKKECQLYLKTIGIL